MRVGLLAAACVLPPSRRAVPGTTGRHGAIVYQSPDGLAIVNGDGSGSERVSVSPSDLDARHADWSPDGSRLVYVADESRWHA